MSYTDIAKQDNVSELTVQRSVERFDVFQSLFTEDQLQRQIIQMSMNLMTEEEESLRLQLRAVKRDTEGTPLVDENAQPLPDFETRKLAHDTITKRLEAVQKKGGGLSITTGVAVGNQPAVVEHTTIGSSGRFAFEERLREIQRRRTLELPAAPVEGVVIAGEGIDIGEEGDSGDEEVT